jgi:hypothetical protein
MNAQRRLDVAKTILAQLGGARFIAMTGAKDLLAIDDGLQIRVPSRKVNRIMITLRDDRYDMQFIRVHGLKVTNVARVEGVYADQLAELFTEHTGLDTRL